MDEKQTPASSAPTLAVLDENGDYRQPRGIGFGGDRNVLSDGSQVSTKKGEEEDGEVLPVGEELENLEKQPTEVSLHHPSSFPDGGPTAWLSVLGGFAALFCSFGWINCIGVFQGYYQANQLKEYSPSTVSWISSLETFCMFFFGPVVGKYYDAYGSRFILLLGTFLHVFGLMMASISSKYWHFIICQGIVSATGASFIFYPALGDVSTWFFKRRAFALGIMASGSSMGGVVLPIMIQRLIPRVGFGWTMRITAFLILGMMVIANLTVRSRLQPKGWTPFRLKDFLKHFKEPGFSMSVLAAFLFFFGMFLPFNYIVVAAKKHGMSTSLANYLVSIMNGISIFGRILPGWLGDKLGRYNMMILTASVSGILVLALWLPTSGNLPNILFVCFYGFTTGAFVSLAPACLAQISDIREIGVRNGSLFAVVSIGALTGVPIGGALVDKYNGRFLGLQIFCGVSLLAGSVAWCLARGLVGGWKVTTRV
ncbi:MFS general substrate transporter [Choiromyces venosus 120613-1]|uniref:MFS general substrate transporter n=1 Tax=Choiromyces venosus 120613-1 TaxID=1336337 RepID=A0A3N4JL02_9PEZI|nr:MFS general substrate transporter [Choiromyces venosus 120613-1]